MVETAVKATIAAILAVVAWAFAMYAIRYIRKPRWRENIEAYLYLLPAGVILVTFWFFPVIFSVLVSMSDWVGASKLSTVHWVWFENYRRALKDPEFRQVLYNTINYVIYSVPLTIVASLIVAMMMNTRVRGVGVFRTIYFLPFVTTWVAISIVFKYIFNEQFGLLNYFLEGLGLPTFAWLNESRGIFEMILRDGLGLPLPEKIHPLLAGPSLAMFSVILTSVWRDTGYFMVIFLAGLQNIDKTYYEAAEIDGASPWQKFRNITWPLLSPTTFFILIISMIAAFKVFVPMYIMTPTGGPGRTTQTLVFYLYQTGFQGYKELGYASAIAYVLFVLILILTIIQNRVFGKKVHYE
ncbi:MAG: sugar ABC transporter permease [Candidatus Hydrogenedentota bacterium]|nr:MAG: sugar ABC transporter permease [Candidatus Hydrogenedentota bacterium]